jgi:riboflavin kinase/FMN adenylyltransferase
MKSFTGEVVHGSKRAALLGYPTINIECADCDLDGIYAAKVVIDGAEFLAAAFRDAKRGVLEAHLLDMSGNLYGKTARIDVYEKIRDNRRFENDGDLKAAMASDVALVRAYFLNI